MIELSKRDIWGQRRVSAERPDVNHHLLAVDFLPASLQRLALARVAKGLCEGRLKPLPAVVHSISNVHAALRQMSQVKGRVWAERPFVLP